MRRIAWLFVLPSLAALGWHAYVAVRDTDVSPYRLAALAAGVAVVAFGASLWRGRTASGPWAIVSAVLASGLLWLTVLEFRVERGRVLAFGLLCIVAAALVHATALIAVSRPRAGAGRAARIGLSLSVVAVLCCAIEGAFRALFPLQRLYDIVPDDPSAGPFAVPRDGMTVPSPGFRGQYVHPEFHGSRIEINALGMRDGLDETTPPPPGALSVLVVGDSFCFGTGVALDETFHERLEQPSAAISQRPVCVYGAAVPGYGPAGYRRRIAQLAPQTRPDAVVVGLFEGNDLQDNLGADEVPAELRTEAAAAQQAGRGSALGRFLRGACELPYWAGSSAAVQKLGIDVTLVRLGLAGAGLYNYVFLDQGLLVPPPPLAQRMRDATIEQLAQIDADCRALPARLVVLAIPDGIQADPARYEQFRAGLAHVGATYDRTAFHDDLVARLRARGITVVDVLPQLEAEITAGRDCYHREGHWNAHGHEIAAAALAPVLAEVLRQR